MPSAYAHYRFGREVLNGLPKDIQTIIQGHRELYDIGLHGPDLLFYYQPLHSCPVNRLGYAMHDEPGETFFRPAAEMLKRRRQSTAHLAYVYGFLCHFALDMTCHGYVDEWIAASGVPHTEIEMEFDRMLLIQDGIDPLRRNLVAHIRPSMDSARVIADFLPGVTKKQAYRALKSIVFYQQRLLAPGRVWRCLLYTGIHLSGHDEDLRGMVMSRTPNPKCAESNRHLAELYRKAIELARELIAGWAEQMCLPTPWEGPYRYTFGSQYKPAEEEKHV